MAPLDNRIGETLIESRCLRNEARRVKRRDLLQPIKVHAKNVWDVQCPPRPDCKRQLSQRHILAGSGTALMSQ
jgi:hypothetical protein